MKISQKPEEGKKIEFAKLFEHDVPIVFEECFVRHRGNYIMSNCAKMDTNSELYRKVDPTLGLGYLSSVQNDKNSPALDREKADLHLYVLAHGFGGR